MTRYEFSYKLVILILYFPVQMTQLYYGNKFKDDLSVAIGQCFTVAARLYEIYINM